MDNEISLFQQLLITNSLYRFLLTHVIYNISLFFKLSNCSRFRYNSLRQKLNCSKNLGEINYYWCGFIRRL
jgi:hypothetical protein